jgi:hypothetical protein
MADLGNERTLFIVNADQDEEYSQWYRSVHIPELLATIPGFVSGQLFELSPTQLTAAGPDLRRFVAVYEIEGDPAAVITPLRDARSQGRLSSAPSSARSTSTSAFFAPVMPRLASAAASVS